MTASVRARYASLIAFCEARDRQLQLQFGEGDDGCGRQQGGKFGPGNSCQADGAPGGQDVAQSIRRQSEITGVASFSGANVPKAFGGASQVKVSAAQQTLEIFDAFAARGVTLDQAVAMSPGAKEPGAEVVIGSHDLGSLKAVKARTKIPLDGEDNSAIIKTEIEMGSGGSPLWEGMRGGVKFDRPVQTALHLDLFQVSDSVQRAILDGHEAQKTPEGERTPEQSAAVESGSRLERQIASKMLSLTTAAIAAAEEAGIDAVYTYAAGSGSGSTNLSQSTGMYRGYALWGRFGLDGVVGRPGTPLHERLTAIGTTEGHPDRSILSEDAWKDFLEGDTLMLQDLIESKQGERLWREWGRGADFFLDLRDKSSKGYRRLQRMKKAAGRAGDSREFFWWLAEHRGDPFDYFKVERRNCGTGSGGFQKGNTCGGQLAADVAEGAVKGAAVGAAAAAGKTMGFPPAVASGAAAGAAAGAVKGLYDNRMRPTRAAKAIAAIGSNDEQVASLVKSLGGTPKSVAEANGKKAVSIAVKDSSGKTSYEVSMDAKSVRIAPAKGKGSMTKSEVERVRAIATEVSPKGVEVSVNEFPPSTLARFVRAGASIAVSATGALVASFVGPMAPAIAGTAIEASTGMDIEKVLRGRK